MVGGSSQAEMRGATPGREDLDALAERALRLALKTAVAVVGSRDAAADVAQEVAIDAVGSVHRLRDPAAFDAWVHRITVRHAVRAIRRERARRLAEIPLARLRPADEPVAADIERHAERIDAREALARALARLPARQRLALALRYVHDLPDTAVAEALGCRVGTAHSLLSRGRAALRGDCELADLAPAPTGEAR